MTTDKQIIDRVEEGFAGFSAAFDIDGRLHARLAALAAARTADGLPAAFATAV